MIDLCSMRRHRSSELVEQLAEGCGQGVVVLGVEVPAGGLAATSGRAVESARATGQPWAIASTAGMPKLSQVEGKTRADASA